jgi:hypothetical protein
VGIKLFIIFSGDSDDEDEDRENLIGEIEDSGGCFKVFSLELRK